MSHCPSVFVVLLLIYDLFPFWQNTQPDGGYFANIQKEAAVARYIDDFDKKFWSGGLFLILSVWAEFASKTSSFLIFVGVVCLDRWIVMFFVGLLVVEGFCWCEVGYGYLQVKCSVFSLCEVSYGYLRVLSLNECVQILQCTNFVYVFFVSFSLGTLPVATSYNWHSQ